MLMPKKVKFRKQQRGRRRGLATRGAKGSFGDYGLQALEVGWVTARQIEARRQDLDPHLPGQADHQEAARDPYG